MKNKILYAVAVAFSICLLFFVVGVTWIVFEVKSACRDASGKHGGDCVTALSRAVDDPAYGFSKRNYAIWSLGQLGDPRALPVLEKYYTGKIPEREPYHKGISQYELRKAINLVQGGTNIIGFIYDTGLADMQ
jgi:hypothetical protein